MLPASHTPKFSKAPLTATKKNPEQPTVPGFASLLPQLVGSFDPGGVSWGMGDVARVRPIKSKS